MNKNKLKIVLGSVLLAMGLNANAGNVQPDVTVTGNMLASCVFSAGNNFTATGNGLSITKSSHTIGITCDNGLPYSISQSTELFTGGSYAFLYKDAAFTQKITTNQISGTGNASEQTYPVYVLWSAGTAGSTPITTSKSGVIGVSVTF